MREIDGFLLHDIAKAFESCEVGFIIDDVQSYNRALASVRMRCYDMLVAMERAGIRAELYKPYKRYRAVIFTKTRSNRAVSLATKLHERGTAVISDAFCEKLENEDDWERNNVLNILKYADAVVTFSKSQYEQFAKYHNNVCIIEESVNDKFFKVQKHHEDKEKITLLYCGYAYNAQYTSIIKNVIKNLQAKYNCNVLFICEKDPCITEFPYQYKKYFQGNIEEMLLEGDIMIAPRPMKGIEGLAHTLSKIAHPMAVGLPVVASPVPSYVGSPAILCTNDTQWQEALENLIERKEERERIGSLSRRYIKEHYSQEIICQQYINLIKTLEKEKLSI